MTAVTIVGGGLAGMTAALRLLERGCRVSLYEAASRLGGKAGATLIDGEYEDHGYHIFPAWYLNAWRLVDELGIRGNFVDRGDFYQLLAGEFPRFRLLRNITSPWWTLPNLFSGFMSVPEMVLLFYAAVDLMSQDYSYRGYLDQVSLIGFLRSRVYRTETVAAQTQQVMLKGVSVPAYYVSAMTMRNVLRFWLAYPLPMYRIARGNLQERWIDPIRRRLERLGCAIHLGRRLERIEVAGGRVARLRFRDQNDQTRSEAVQAERVILAVPVEQVTRVLDDAVYAAAPRLANLRYLRSQAMAALSVYLARRLRGIPRDNVNLIDSRFGLSFVDVSQTWPGYDATVLNAIASDFTPLEGLSAEEATAQLLDELRRFVPGLAPGVVRRTVLQPHVGEPLFMNEVGSWPFRPDPTQATELPNLYLAGDYCRSHIDLTCMEGAITTGLCAAEAVRRDAGLPSPVEILRPREPARWVQTLLTVALLPIAAAAKGLAVATEPVPAGDSAPPLVGMRQATKGGLLRRPPQRRLP